MNRHKIACGGCGSTFIVEQDKASKRCPSCGTLHSEPWTVPSVESSPLPEAGKPEALGIVDQASTDADAETITIDVNVSGAK